MRPSPHPQLHFKVEVVEVGEFYMAKTMGPFAQATDTSPWTAIETLAEAIASVTKAPRSCIHLHVQP